MLTTCIGAYPKPDFVKLPDWFGLPASEGVTATKNWADAMRRMGSDAEAILSRGVEHVLTKQIEAGINIPTDGEIPRENYIHYHCRHLTGFDFDNLTQKEVRGGAYSTSLPTIHAPIRTRDHFLPADWRRAQSFCDAPVKMSMPGALTIADTTCDNYYNSPRKLGADLADALNAEVLALAEAGCTYIQIDEPVFARQPAAALMYGIENLDRAFHRCPKHVTRVVHICCGYPDLLDSEEYPKADPEHYFQLAEVLEDSSVHWVSIEDACHYNDLKLLEIFKTTTVVLGAVAIARSRVESVDEIYSRLHQACAHIDKDRLVAAPDCGLGLLNEQLVQEKLANLCTAAKRL